MVDDKAKVNDGNPQLDVAPAEAVTKKEYTVVSDDGLFKNGKNYKKDSKVELDAKTAAAFIANGDIKE